MKQIDYRLTRDNRELIKKRNDEIFRDEDEDEETLSYAERPKDSFLNESHGVFDTRTLSGLNSDPDVFEKNAVFHVPAGQQMPEEGYVPIFRRRREWTPVFRRAALAIQAMERNPGAGGPDSAPDRREMRQERKDGSSGDAFAGA